MNIKVKEMSLEDLEAYVDARVEEKLRELIGDPDAGLELSDKIKRQLKTPATECVPLEKVIRDLALKLTSYP